MCGIAGILNFNGVETRQAEALHRMANQMIHRGPDDEGYLLVNRNGQVKTYKGEDTRTDDPAASQVPGYPAEPIQNAYENRSCIAMGHRRLSILDLSSHGHQPLCTRDKRYWIVFNGEIYNYKNIASQLEKEGIRFHGHSDTEVLLNAYVLWGEKCLDRFNGDFAFAIWDNENNHLFCARDRIGIKPFYYTINNNQLIFASDIKTILASGLYRAEVNPEGLYFAMAFGISPRPITAFKGIYALEQSHWMCIGPGGRIEKQRYWNIPVGSQDHDMSLDDATELLETELTEAIRIRLHSDVPVGTFMSGGIDSTTISAIASRLHPGIKAFTLAYENQAPDLDEVSQAEATARINPLEHIIHRVDPDETLPDLDTWIAGYEEPFHSLAANHVISKIVKQNNVTVVLNGLGGDELFAGYQYYKFARFWPLISPFSPLVKYLLPIMGSKGERLSGIDTVKSSDQLHTLIFRNMHDGLLNQLFDCPELANVDTLKELKDLYANGIEFDDSIEAMSYMDLMNYIGNHHVHRVDQFTMMNSVEGRFPLLDHRLIEAAFQIPSKWKLNGRKQKYVLREVAKKYIDPSCLSMKKKGFTLPLQQWMKGPLLSLIEVKISALKERPIISAETVSRWLEEYQRGNFSAARIWHLVALELWFERFIDPD